MRGFCLETLCSSGAAASIWDDLQVQVKSGLLVSKMYLRKNKTVGASSKLANHFEDRERVLDALRGPNDELVIDDNIQKCNRIYFARVVETALNTLAKDDGKLLHEMQGSSHAYRKIPNLSKLCDIVHLSARFYY